MAIESTLEIEVEGLNTPIQVSGGYSRIVRFRGEAQQIGQVQGYPPTPGVSITFQEWQSAEAATKVFEEKRILYEGDPKNYVGVGSLVSETKTRTVAVPFDNKNIEHVRQRNEQITHYENAVKRGVEGLVPIEIQLETWEPSEIQEYEIYFETMMVWNGETKQKPLREREVILPLEQAIQVVQHQVPGGNPQQSFNEIASELYRAAMLSGAFKDPKVA